MLPTEGRQATFTGRIGAETDCGRRRKAARLAALMRLPSHVRLGVTRQSDAYRRLGVAVATAGDVKDQPKVADGASELLQQIFGKEKTLPDSCMGVAPPARASVELELIFEVTGLREEPDVVSHDADRWPVISYREAGPKDGPTLLLLHGLPFRRGCSSRSSPGFPIAITGRARLPGLRAQRLAGPEDICLHVRHYAEIINHFAERSGSRATRCTCRITAAPWVSHGLAHPERIEALIVQDAVAHNEGLGANWKSRGGPFGPIAVANESAPAHQSPGRWRRHGAPCRQRS